MEIITDRIEKLNSAFQNSKADYESPKPPALLIAFWRFMFSTLGWVFPNFFGKIAYRFFSTPRIKAKHTRTDAIIDAAKVSDFLFRQKKIKLYTWGEPINQKKILIIHGWESRGTALRMFVPDLVQQGYQVVAFDALAHGDSEGTWNNLHTNAHCVSDIIGYLGGVYGVICHSFGCATILYAQEYVDNSINIERVVLISAPPPSKDITEGYFRIFNVPAGVRRAFYSQIEYLTGRNIEDVNLIEAYNKVHIGKMLLVHDKYDTVTPLSTAERIIAYWQNARLLITEGYGHYRVAKNPDVVKYIIRFIQS
jgi:pimeloyl-ACP methyl ester carboxylesterase